MNQNPPPSTTTPTADVSIQQSSVPTFPEEKPYSVFSSRERWAIVAICAFAGLFSPLTANIYFPAIPQIAQEFNKSIELINLTVTVYMILQGLSPMIWGTMSDTWGRRPIFIACLAILVAVNVGLALIPTSAYWALMLLRCVQAAGSASTIALGAGVIGDIAVPGERGSFYGFFSFGPMVGPTIGPVLGGILAGHLGWRSIFWFLCISTGVCLLAMILVLPETLRPLVGDGSIRPPAVYRPVLPIIGKPQRDALPGELPSKKGFVNPLRLFTYPDVVVLLIFNGIGYAVFYSITASLSSLFQEVYSLNETNIGLCFLASGGGMIFGSIVTGKQLDWEHARVTRQLAATAKSGSSDVEGSGTSAFFPVERIRLRLMPIYVFISVVATVGYGWCMQQRVHIAGPLCLQFVLKLTFVSILNTTQTLLIDLAPVHSASITSCNNLVRCSLGALMVSVIDIMISRLTVGWSYVLLGGVVALSSAAIPWLMHMGPMFRLRRLRAAEAAKLG